MGKLRVAMVSRVTGREGGITLTGVTPGSRETTFTGYWRVPGPVWLPTSMVARNQVEETASFFSVGTLAWTATVEGPFWSGCGMTIRPLGTPEISTGMALLTVTSEMPGALISVRQIQRPTAAMKAKRK